MLIDILYLVLAICILCYIHSIEKKMLYLNRQISALYFYIQKKDDITPAEIAKMCEECTDEDLSKMNRIRK